jgi:hypothetical protein
MHAAVLAPWTLAILLYAAVTVLAVLRTVKEAHAVGKLQREAKCWRLLPLVAALLGVQPLLWADFLTAFASRCTIDNWEVFPVICELPRIWYNYWQGACGPVGSRLPIQNWAYSILAFEGVAAVAMMICLLRIVQRLKAVLEENCCSSILRLVLLIFGVLLCIGQGGLCIVFGQLNEMGHEVFAYMFFVGYIGWFIFFMIATCVVPKEQSASWTWAKQATAFALASSVIYAIFYVPSMCPSYDPPSAGPGVWSDNKECFAFQNIMERVVMDALVLWCLSLPTPCWTANEDYWTANKA